MRTASISTFSRGSITANALKPLVVAPAQSLVARKLVLVFKVASVWVFFRGSHLSKPMAFSRYSASIFIEPVANRFQQR